MDRKDYKRLAKISLKARKKNTRSTVRGISFGLILLLPLLFIVTAFYIDVNSKVDKDPTIRCFNLNITDRMSSETWVDGIYINYENQLLDIEGIDNYIRYSDFTFSGMYGYEIDSNFYIPTDRYYGGKEDKLKIIDTYNSTSLFLDLDKYVSSNLVVAGNEFSNNSKGEIMLSSDFVSERGLTPSAVINKNISIYSKYEGSYSITSSDISWDGNIEYGYDYNDLITICDNFKIVGVFDSKICESEARKGARYYDENFYGDSFWITTDSISTDNTNPSIAKNVTFRQHGYDSSYYYYPTNIKNRAIGVISDGYMFIPVGLGANYTNSYSYPPVYKYLLEFNSFKDAYDSVSIINKLAQMSSTSTEDVYFGDNYMTPTFSNYRGFYQAFMYVCIALGIFGGVVFFATLLNLYNTIQYSVQSRKNYLGMLRAIGMKDKDILRMYRVEIMQIFKRAYKWVLIFGGIICLAIFIAFNSVMKSEYASFISIDISMNPVFILVAFLIEIVIDTIIALIYSNVACKNVYRKPILEVLVDDK